MNSKSSTIKAFTCKALFIVIGTLSAFASLTTCDAQSVAGKWHQVSAS